MGNIFTENINFYPTPREVIEKMVFGEELYGKTILEPSAGKGDISSFLMEKGAKVLVCEIEPHNIKLLNGKYDEFLAEDFLTVTAEQVSHVDMIVMNPFDNADKHIIHAFDIAPAGSTIIALCNRETLRNCFTERRIKLAEYIENHGHAEEIGQVFRDAERGSDVYVSLVKLYKEGSGESEFDSYIFDMNDNDSLSGNESQGLIQYNVIRDLVNRYTQAVRMFDEVMEASNRINEIAKFNITDVNGKPKTYQPDIPIKFGALCTDHDRRNTHVSHDFYKKELKKYYWRVVFDMMGMDRYNTVELRKQMNRFIETQQHVPFTMSNIFKMIDLIIQTHGQRMQMAIEDAFDKICSLSAQNSTAGEKWKTNANYMVNRKFIVDYIARCDWEGEIDINWGHSKDCIDDLTKALCFLTGTSYESIDTLSDSARLQDAQWGKWFDWGFFRVKVFKKGTGHFEFKDEKVWALFNQTVAKARGWQVGTK